MSIATIRSDPKGGYEVVDSRSGEPVAWRGSATSAGELTDYLNAQYPQAPYPAWDTLLHEVIGARIAGIAG